MNDCIEHPGPSRDKNGYGIKWIGGKPKRAHRIAWQEAHGSIPEGMYILHACDNPPCVNVDHLFLGTAKDNAADRDSKGRAVYQHGPANGNAKLTAEDVTEIRRDYIREYERIPRGRSWVWRSNAIELGSKYGVSKYTIRRVVLNKGYVDASA